MVGLDKPPRRRDECSTCMRLDERNPPSPRARGGRCSPLQQSRPDLRHLERLATIERHSHLASCSGCFSEPKQARRCCGGRIRIHLAQGILERGLEPDLGLARGHYFHHSSSDERWANPSLGRRWCGKCCLVQLAQFQ